MIWGGGALLDWIAGSLLPDDPAIAAYVPEALSEKLDIACGIAGAIIVVSSGKIESSARGRGDL